MIKEICNENIKIFIYWSGPYNYNEILNDIDKGEEYYSKPSHRGLYQIYSSHPLYGDSVLTYIGMTDNSFKSRLKDREIIKLNKDTNNIQIYLGRLYFDDIYMKPNKPLIKQYINYAETLLINFHKPAMNSQNITSFKHMDKNITVINEGSYRMLEHEISTVGLYHDENSVKQLRALKIKIEDKIRIDLIEEDFKESYGFINRASTFWVGFIFEYWAEETILMIGTKDKLDDDFVKDEKYENWYYKSIIGTEEEVIDQVIKYAKKVSE